MRVDLLTRQGVYNGAAGLKITVPQYDTSSNNNKEKNTFRNILSSCHYPFTVS